MNLIFVICAFLLISLTFKKNRYNILSKTDKNGYKRDFFTSKLVNRIIIENKIKKPLGKPVVHHKYCDKSNNSLSNLIVMNRSDHNRIHWVVRHVKNEKQNFNIKIN